jgi:hypothetical protein
MARLKTYFWNLLEALSQLGNAILGGNPNITMSAWAYLRRERKPLRYKLINKFFFWQEDHCRSSWVSDIVFARQALFELETPRRANQE